ncbi:ferredoxin-NADP reductase [Chitinophaga skermanii]|uniref:Ferredoxin-NADP reductase n=1 Tax=Chitinophaga skermanii TaxID=331697 RepID=A0A327Q834_9BACT|nr:FAD-binding oxidoreductase [Chitinophaga skermanii]RAI99412.1 ferredoxin-NADP reductase [Chitinophaga skermanii]
MAEHVVKILRIDPVTHNVKRFKVEKPAGYSFIPGQATDVAINQPRWKDQLRPFTFTALNNWDHLEFTIKMYRDHDGVTNHLDTLQVGDELILHDVWGAIQYKGEGIFIAGGAGITPFIAIFRQLYQDGKVGENKLIFSNQTTKDIILKDEFQKILGKNFLNVITKEKVDAYDFGIVNEDYLRKKVTNFNQPFYICGPDRMVAALQEILQKLGAPTIVVEM